jgi:hypothetical protein
MFLDDPLENGWIARRVPRSFRIYDSDGPTFTDAQTVGFCAEHTAGLRQAQLFEPRLQILPSQQASVTFAALRIRLIRTQKNMPARARHADRRGNVIQSFKLVGCHMIDVEDV